MIYYEADETTVGQATVGRRSAPSQEYEFGQTKTRTSQPVSATTG